MNLPSYFIKSNILDKSSFDEYSITIFPFLFPASNLTFVPKKSWNESSISLYIASYLLSIFLFFTLLVLLVISLELSPFSIYLRAASYCLFPSSYISSALQCASVNFPSFANYNTLSSKFNILRVFATPLLLFPIISATCC